MAPPSSGNSPSPGLTRRGLAAAGGAALSAFALSPGVAASPSAAENRPAVDVTAAPFLARGDGVADDAMAIRAAVASLPPTGGIVLLPGGRRYRLETTVDDGGKPVTFEIGHAHVVGPARGPLFDLRTNGSAIVGQGPGATVLHLNSSLAPPAPPRVAIQLRGGRVSGASVQASGSGIATTPLLEVGNSPTDDSAAFDLSLRDGRVIGVTPIAAGTGYRDAPNVQMIGGGECAVRLYEASHCRLAGFTIDMAGLAHAVGIFQFGGWYADMSRIDVAEARQHASAIALLIDSHTLGRAGPNGNWGGAYVNRYAQLIAKRTVVIGHDTSKATTLHFDTLDTATLHLQATIGVLLSNTVLQGNEGAFLDLVNVDGLTMVGGDVEGAAALVRARGVCDNIRLAPLAYSATGAVVRGPIGTGWRLDLAKANAGDAMLCTGSTGSAGVALQNTGWTERHRAGIQYSGGSVVYSSNLRLTGPYEGILDNPENPGFALVMTVSGQLILRRAQAGARKTVVRDVAMFDDGGVQLHDLPSSRPPAGSKRLWFDPADGFTVKFQP